MRRAPAKRFELWHTIATIVAFFIALCALDFFALLIDLGSFSFLGAIGLGLALCAIAYLLCQLIEQATLLARSLIGRLRKFFPA
ncbi:hypothetical protein BH09VER1_BH09VER1_48290 [soil metagenome]